MFQLGDKVKPIRNNRYELGEEMILLVMAVDNSALHGDNTRVQVVNAGYGFAPGQQFTLDSSQFELIKPRANREELSMWVDKEGNGIKFADMTDDHLFNVVAMLHRKEGKKNAQRSKLVSLEKELAKRLQKRLA